MSDAAALINQARSLGATLEVHGETVRLKAPAPLPPSLIETMRQHKVEVMEYLRQQGSGAAASETCHLLAWASELAEQDLVLSSAVTYIEAPLRRVTTERVSWYAAHYLRTIVTARIGQQTGGWGMYDRHWHRKCEEEALSALAALREALMERQVRQRDGDA